MNEPLFLNREIVAGLHRKSLEKFGGSDGVRDEGLVESALGAALNDYHYGGADLFGIAAAYAFHLAQAQAFLDGNKRTGVAAALVFLDLNGESRLPSDQDIYEALIAIAERRLDKAGIGGAFSQGNSFAILNDP